MEKKIRDLIEDTVINLGFNIVKVTVRGSVHKIVEISIERFDSAPINTKDCQLVSRNISALLDVEDIVAGKYSLEVSSAGVERPLVRKEDFIKYANREVKIRLKTPHNGNLSFKGKLGGVEDDQVKLKSKNVELLFDFDNIKSANLVLTDEIFRKLLNNKVDI